MSGGGFSFEEAMDLEKPYFSSKDPENGGGLSSSCSICLEVVLDQGGRSIAKLQCGHEFHLDCIGSAFNAKGAMQCPNCRKVEKGRWLYAHGHRPCADFDLDGWVTEDFYDLSYPELPFGFQWCPFRGFTQLASFFEEGESQQNSYIEPMGNTAFGDHSSAASSTHVCPYLAVQGFPPTIHSAPSSSADDNVPFHRHPASLGGQSSASLINSHSSATELRNHEWLQRPSFLFPLSLSADQSTSHLGVRLSRNDTSSQQRVGSFVHPHPLAHGSVARGGSNVVTSIGAPLMGEVRGHTRGHGSHMYQQSATSSTLRNSSPFAPIRRARARPRGASLVSSVATSSSAEIGGFHGFSVSGSENRSHQDSENISRHFDRIYGWGREGFTPLPWIPLEGESQWWGPFNPQSGSFPPRVGAERATQSRPENGYQRMPPPWMPPFT